MCRADRSTPPTPVKLAFTTGWDILFAHGQAYLLYNTFLCFIISKQAFIFVI